MKKLLNKKGFTLIELIVVIAILAILALILIPSLLNYLESANTSKEQANTRSLYSEAALIIATTTVADTTEATAISVLGMVDPEGMKCTYESEGKVLTEFSCEGSKYTYSAPSFTPVE